MNLCKLCDGKADLCDSHIVPEFLFKPLYDSSHKMVGIHGLGRKGAKPLQKGIRDKLFCKKCEGFLNDTIEKPFLAEWEIFREVSIPGRAKPWDILVLDANYKFVKLFTLSVLFRCSISTLPTFGNVNLGKHEARIKNMILTGNPGSEDQYPLMVNLVRNKGQKPEIRYISQPVEYREGGHRMYGQIYGGYMWWHKVSSHHHVNFRSAIRTNNALHVAVTPINEIGVLHMAKAALTRPSNGASR